MPRLGDRCVHTTYYGDTYRCAICRALVTDAFATIALTRERPRSPADSSHGFVVGLLGRVCKELPTRRHVAPALLAEVREECATFAEEHQVG